MARLKILFLYPNHKGMTMLPPGISLLSAVLKREGFVVDLFDTTQYDSVEIDGEKNFKELPKERSSRYKKNIYNNFNISCIGLLS